MIEIERLRKHATTIILGALCLVFAVWLLFDRDKITDTERQRRERSVFPAWRRDELTRIEITKGVEKVVLVRDAKKDSSWSMTSPREERTDFAAVEKLLTTLEFASVVRKVTETAVGFDAPRAEGTVQMGGLSFRFVLGGPSPRPEGSSYFRLGNDPPIVVSRELTQALLAGADAYRTRSVVPYLSTELDKLEVKGFFALARLDDRLFASGGLVASREDVDKIWNALAELRAESFPKEADVDRLTADPALTIVMTPKSGAPGEIRIGAACPGEPNDVVAVVTSPARLAACVPKGAVESLKKPAASLVSKRPFTMRADETEELRLERLGDVDAGVGPPKAIELARKGGGFKQREPVDRDLPADEAEAASALLAAIERVTATSVAPRGDKPFAPAFRARLRAGDRDEIVEIASPDGEKVLVNRKRDDALLELSREEALRLVPRETTLRPRALVNEARPVKRVVLRCGIPQELVDEGSGFRLVDPAGYTTDATITQLVDGILRARVDRWVADEGAFGITPEGCRVVLAFEDGNAPITVRFGAEDAGTVYGKIDGSPHVFVMGNGLLALARSVFVSRASLRVDPSRIESVRVTAPAPTVTRQAALRDALSGFIADRVVSLGDPQVDPELTIDVTIAEGGPPKRISCSSPDKEGFRKCVTPLVRAVFRVSRSVWSRFFEAAEGGILARDAGSR